MEFGDDLSLDMLSSDQDGSDDFLISEEEGLLKDLDEETGLPLENKEEPAKKELNISEKQSASESVASEEGKKGAPDAASSPKASDKLATMYSSLASHLNETGVLPSLDIENTEIKTVEALQAAIKAEIDSGLDENTRMYKEAMSKGEPQEAYVKYIQSKNQLDGITDDVIESNESADLRLNIIAQDFLNRGFSKEESLKFAKRSQDLSEDANDAKNSLVRIKEHNESSYQKHVNTEAASQQKAVDDINKFINTTEEIIKGVKLTKGVKDNLLAQMTTAVSQDPEGKPLTAYGDAMAKTPVETKAITEYLFLITKGFTDFSKMTSLIETKAISKMDDLLQNSSTDFLQNGRANLKDKESSFSLEDGFEIG